MTRLAARGDRLNYGDIVTTIEEIEQDPWPEPDPATSTLVRRCTALRRKPIDDLTIEDLRILLGQRIAVPTLLPVAIAVLLRNPLAEGDYCPGALLHVVVRLPQDSWNGRTTQREQLTERVAPLLDLADLDPHLRPDIQRFVE